MFTSPSQVLFTIFGINIYYYGVVMSLAIASGILFADWFGTKYFNLKRETIIDLAPYLIIFGLLGARLYYCIMDYQFYWRFPEEILAIRHGGISIHGGILGGFFGLLAYSTKHKVNLKKLCDITSIGLVLGQSIGRWGNFFNSEAYGTPTNLPWKLYIAPQYRIIPYEKYDFFHPTFLYESILDLSIFVILIFYVLNRKNKKDGNIALIYLLLYSLARIIVENYRIDSVRFIFNQPVAIIISICIIMLTLVLFLFNNKREGN